MENKKRGRPRLVNNLETSKVIDRVSLLRINAHSLYVELVKNWGVANTTTQQMHTMVAKLDRILAELGPAPLSKQDLHSIRMAHLDLLAQQAIAEAGLGQYTPTKLDETKAQLTKMVQ